MSGKNAEYSLSPAALLDLEAISYQQSQNFRPFL
jgi:hypothetical protein